jgi:hypothetical protein
MTTMSEYLSKLAAWHKSEQTAAEDRSRHASTQDCIAANKRAIHRHETASRTLFNLSASIKRIEAATDFIQGE